MLGAPAITPSKPMDADGGGGWPGGEGEESFVSESGVGLQSDGHEEDGSTATESGGPVARSQSRWLDDATTPAGKGLSSRASSVRMSRRSMRMSSVSKPSKGQ